MPENQPAKIQSKNPKTHVFDWKWLTCDSISFLPKSTDTSVLLLLLLLLLLLCRSLDVYRVDVLSHSYFPLSLALETSVSLASVTVCSFDARYCFSVYLTDFYKAL